MVFLTLYKTWKVRYTMSCCWLPHSRWFSCNMVLIGGQYLHFQTWLKILVLACWMLKLSFADALKSYMLVYPHEHLTKSLYIPMICPLHPLFLARPIWFPSSPDFFPSKSPSNPITRRVTWKNPMKSLTSNKIQLRFAWNSHEIVISFLLSPTGGLQKIQEVKAEVQRKRSRSGEVGDALWWGFNHEIPMKSHEITSLWGGEFHGRCNDGDFMGFEWRCLMRIWMAWKTGF